MFSQIFAIAGNQAYNDPPYYRHGNATALGLQALCLIISLMLRWHFQRKNDKKRQQKDSSEAVQQRLQSTEEVGAAHPGKLLATTDKHVDITDPTPLDFYHSL